MSPWRALISAPLFSQTLGVVTMGIIISAMLFLGSFDPTTPQVGGTAMNLESIFTPMNICGIAAFLVHIGMLYQRLSEHGARLAVLEHWKDIRSAQCFVSSEYGHELSRRLGKLEDTCERRRPEAHE